MAEEIFIDSSADLIAFGVPFGQQFLIFGSALAGLFFFLLDLGGFGLQFGLGGFHFLVAGVGVHHQFENLVFVDRNFFLGELDLMEQCFVLLRSEERRVGKEGCGCWWLYCYIV